MDTISYTTINSSRYDFAHDDDLIRLWWICQKVHEAIRQGTRRQEWSPAHGHVSLISKITALVINPDRLGLAIAYRDHRALTVLWDVLGEEESIALIIFGSEGLEQRILTLTETLTNLLETQSFSLEHLRRLH